MNKKMNNFCVTIDNRIQADLQKKYENHYRTGSRKNHWLYNRKKIHLFTLKHVSDRAATRVRT